MALPDSGKIALGVVAGIGAILIVHFTVFKDRAAKFETAKNSYDGVVNEYRSIGTARALKDVYEFQYETLKYEEEYWKFLKDLNLQVERQYAGATRNVAEQRADLLRVLLELETRRDDGKGPELRFLGPQGWDLRTELPAMFTTQGVNVEDPLARLLDADRVLEVLDQQSDLYKTRLQEYENLLRIMGMDLAQRDAIRETYGELPALIYSLNRVQLVQKSISPGFFRDLTTPEEVSDRLYKLFRVQWIGNDSMPLAMFSMFKQSKQLLDMLDVGEETRIATVERLKCWDTREIFYTPLAEVKPVSEEPATAGQRQPPPERRDGGGVNPRFRGNQRGGQQRQSGATTDEKVGYGAPFEIAYYAQNEANMLFLDALTRRRLPFELDKIKINTVQTQGAEGFVLVEAVFNVFFHVEFLSFTREAIELELKKNLSEKVKIASKSGAKELALKDGVIDEAGVTVPDPLAAPR